MRSKREAGVLKNKRFVRLGINRVLQKADSGRDYLQGLKECADDPVAHTTFFDALHSPRRCAMVDEAVQEGVQCVLRREMEQANVDYLADFAELASYRVLAGDGHTIVHASHAVKNRRRNSESPSTIYLQDLRTGLMCSFAPVSGDGNRHYEMPVFPRRLVDHENFGKEQTKTLFVVDSAYIDAAFWKPPPGKRQGPWDVITRMKKNMKPTCCGKHQFDRDDPVNAGVRRFWAARFDGAFGLMYVVEFVDPETSEPYRFLTTLDP